MTSLAVSEIFKSIQGESTYAGLPCVFIRLTGCNLRCAYCDTAYAWKGGKEMTIPQILKRVAAYQCGLVEITGGEPLLQEGSAVLMRRLIGKGYRVLLETNGSMDLKRVPGSVVKIMDIKTPGSGMQKHNRYANLKSLDKKDEVKFVIGTRADYDFARRIVRKYRLRKKCAVLLSPEGGKERARQLSGWILRDNLDVRLNLQLHKIIWPAKKRGV